MNPGPLDPGALKPGHSRTGPLRLFVTAGEASGDQLGAALMRDIRELAPDTQFEGLGGALMEAQGLAPIFPISDIAVMGFLPVIKRLPLLLQRIRQTADAVVRNAPDAVVLIDAQDFSKRVAKRIRKHAPDIPIIGYVAPSVWAWRSGRARVLKPLYDRLLAVLPFEPEVMKQLGGPPTDYAGHPLLEKLAGREPGPGTPGSPIILLLPGSRRSEIARLLPIFGQAAALIAAKRPDARFVLPAIAYLADDIRRQVNDWPVQPEIVLGEDAKWSAFFSASAALAASGTVTLELGLAHVPMVVAYQVSGIEAAIVRRLVSIETSVLPDIILGTKDIPLFLQHTCTPEKLAGALVMLLTDGDPRTRQVALFGRLDAAMRKGLDESGRSIAGRLVLKTAREGRTRPQRR